MSPTTTTAQGTTFTAASFGRFADLDQHQFDVPALSRKVRGKVFLREPLGLTAMELSLSKLAPGVAIPFLHQHREHEELYLFVGGTGEMIVDGTLIPVAEGSAVRVAPDGKRALRNTGSVPLLYVCIQAKEGSLVASTIEDGVPVAGPVGWPS